MADLAVGLAKSVVEGTLSKAHAAIQEEAKLRQSAQRDLVFITGEFEMMRSFLNVANAERVENPVVRTWVRQIRELAYDVEDCIELVVHLDKDKTSFLFRIRRLCIPCWARARMPALDQAVDEIEQLKARVSDVSSRNARYSLISDTGAKPVAQQPLPTADVGDTLATSNMLAEARRAQGLVGGGGDLTQLITRKDQDKLQVISVWGSGGDHGTASMVMKAYDDDEVPRNFSHRAWVRLVHPFSPHDLVRSLMLQFCPAEQEQGLDALTTMLQATHEDLIKGLKEVIQRKRYLVVVEGLSNMAEWHALRKILPDWRNGSCIVVATQQPEIAALCVGHSYQILELKHFSAEHSICALFNKGSTSITDGDHKGKKPIVELVSHSDTEKGESSMVEDSSQATHETLIDVSHSETERGESSMVEDSAHARHETLIDDSHSEIEKGEKPMVEDSSHVGHVLEIEDSHTEIEKGEEPMAEDSSHVGQVAEIECSHDNGDKGKKIDDEDSYFVGRESEMKELLEYPGKARQHKSYPVMSVWGIAGVGKSALVKKVYDDTRHHYPKQFGMYYWVDVSHPFNLRDFHRSIPSDFRLEEHGCLIVIDDIKSKQEWDLIQTSLVPRSSKSVIIAITTEASIAAHCSNGEELVFNVKGLEAAAASSLFEKVWKKNQSDSEDLKHFQVRELILKCGGLPKVIVAVAGELAKQTVTWMDEVVSLNRAFMHHLETKLSYDGLRDLFGWLDLYFRTCPDSLKPCIFYLSIFPRDHFIRRRRLVRRFIAEGYSRDGDEESAEENGEKQFSELLDLSVIQQVPHLFTNSLNTRMVLCQVNGFIREYIIPRRKEENLVFELGGKCSLTTQRTGRHLIILKDWTRDKIVFESMDFSRLRSLTVFGSWQPFLICEYMKLLRVLDLEDADNLKDEDLENIVKWMRRLKFLSLRGRHQIKHLPDNMDNLRQLQTLDVRGTSIVMLPENITKLQNLQYIRAGISNIPTSTTPSASSCLPEFCTRRGIVGVMVPARIRKLTALHTLGVVNVAASGRKAMAKALEKLTQLRKIGVSGINRKNIKDFSSAIAGHVHLESLSVHLDRGNQSCLDGITLPLGNLRSLKLYGLNESLPQGTEQLIMLRKLDLEMHTLRQDDITLLAGLPELCILRLRVRINDPSLYFIAKMEGTELSTFNKVKILEISCSSISLISVKFGSNTMKTLELLQLDCSSGTSYDLTAGLNDLSDLKEVLLIANNDESFRDGLANKLGEHPKNPVPKLQERPRSS